MKRTVAVAKKADRTGRNFNPLHRPKTQQCTALQTDRQTDGQTTLWCQ